MLTFYFEIAVIVLFLQLISRGLWPTKEQFGSDFKSALLWPKLLWEMIYQLLKQGETNE